MPKLTSKQKKFVELYSGNASEAARMAGYKGSPEVIRQAGAENLTKPYILAAIKEREAPESAARIATRAQRQEFWTNVLNDENEKMQDRLRASELLGKSEADFLDRVDHSGKIGVQSLLTVEEKEKIAQDGATLKKLREAADAVLKVTKGK